MAYLGVDGLYRMGNYQPGIQKMFQAEQAVEPRECILCVCSGGGGQKSVTAK